MIIAFNVALALNMRQSTVQANGNILPPHCIQLGTNR